MMKRFKRNTPAVKQFLQSLPCKPGIYLISCIDDTTYLGATKNLRQRASSHLSCSGRFHGQRFDILETMETYNVQALRELEGKYLSLFNFEHNSLNASPYSSTSSNLSQNLTRNHVKPDPKQHPF